MTTKGIYHSNSRRQFAHLLIDSDIESSSIGQWFLIVGGDKTCEVDKQNFDTANEAKMYLDGKGFYPLNRNIILCPTKNWEDCARDEFFWERMSAVYGPDTCSVVNYDSDEGYSVAGLHQLGIWRVDFSWIWYGSESDPGLETWLQEQIYEEIATLAFKAEKYAYDDVYQDRHINVSRMMYRTEKSGNKLLFQYENGMVIEF
jgi:hypothetical protein